MKKEGLHQSSQLHQVTLTNNYSETATNNNFVNALHGLAREWLFSITNTTSYKCYNLTLARFKTLFWKILAVQFNVLEATIFFSATNTPAYFAVASVTPGSAITNWREPRSCLGRVFNSKLGCFATPGCKCIVWRMQPLLTLKTRPKARPVS